MESECLGMQNVRNLSLNNFPGDSEAPKSLRTISLVDEKLNYKRGSFIIIIIIVVIVVIFYNRF